MSGCLQWLRATDGYPFGSDDRTRGASFLCETAAAAVGTRQRKGGIVSNVRQSAWKNSSDLWTVLKTVLKMCGLEKYAEAIVGTLGVEHRKRTTIGVELAAKVCKETFRHTVSHSNTPQAQITPIFGRTDFRPRFTKCLGYCKFLARLGQPRSGDSVHVSCLICLSSQHGALTPRSPYSIHQPSAELFKNLTDFYFYEREARLFTSGISDRMRRPL